MRISLPPKRVREKFHTIYELEGCQKAVDFLAEYYRVRRMRIILNGRKVGNGYIACYNEKKAHFTKKGLKKKIVLHEFYHHLVATKKVNMHIRTEEREANLFSNKFLRRNL